MGAFGVREALKTRLRTHMRLAPGELFEVGEAESHHLISVLRSRVGDEIGLVGPSGRLFLGRITSLTPCVAEVLSELEAGDITPSRRVEAWVPLLKSKKTDGLVRQLTELGVVSVVIYVSERSVVRPNSAAVEKLTRRYERISAEATRQCRRIDEVQIRFSKSLPEDEGGFFLWEQEGESSELIRSSEAEISRVLIGPEGGLSAGEADHLRSKNWRPIHLGARILRAETAVIAAVALAIYP